MISKCALVLVMLAALINISASGYGARDCMIVKQNGFGPDGWVVLEKVDCP